jgi:UDP-N-acetylmuramate--alanine ligase
MSAIARFFHLNGKNVMGYDKTPSALTTELEMEGIQVQFGDSVHDLPGILHVTPLSKILIVLTPAVPANHQQLLFFKEKGFLIKKRAEVLGMITADQKTIAVAGTHGKTTTSSMVAHIMKQSGHGCNAFLGGITSNYGTNLLTDPDSPFCVVEADEYDRSFLALGPNIAVITSMDADHLDIYGDKGNMHEAFQAFAMKIKPGGVLILRSDLKLAEREDITLFRYGLDEYADFSARSIQIKNGKYQFDLAYPGGNIREIKLGLPGRHNVENAVAACAAALRSGVHENHIKEALESFTGVQRRFESVLAINGHYMIDDYAHHPEELKACIKSVKELFKGKKVLGIFQPHLFTRTRDFAEGFAKSLELLDEVILLPIYPAREEPIAGVDSQLILNKIKKTPSRLLDKSELFDAACASSADVVLTLGAGDIDRLVKPLSERLFAKWNNKTT